MRTIVLASKSPRRTELLHSINLPHTVHPSGFEEHETLPPEELVTHNAQGKAREIATHYPDALIIGVDTIGLCNGEILSKPKHDDDARRMMQLMSNSTHEVITALTLIDTAKSREETVLERTYVTMDSLTEADISAYIASGEGKDKAAGYAIQGLGALFISKIEGDYFNVVGLPIYRLRTMLESFGVRHWWIK